MRNPFRKKKKLKPEPSSLKPFQIWGNVTQLSAGDLNAGLNYWRENLTKIGNDNVAAERMARYEGEVRRRELQSAEFNQTESLEKRISSLQDKVMSLQSRLESLEIGRAHV